MSLHEGKGLDYREKCSVQHFNSFSLNTAYECNDNRCFKNSWMQMVIQITTKMSSSAMVYLTKNLSINFFSYFTDKKRNRQTNRQMHTANYITNLTEVISFFMSKLESVNTTGARQTSVFSLLQINKLNSVITPALHLVSHSFPCSQSLQ